MRSSAPFGLTRRDLDVERDLRRSMRDAYDYIDSQRGARDMAKTAETVFGSGWDLLALLGGAAVTGLTSGLTGTTTIGQTAIPQALIPAGVGYLVSGFDLLGDKSRYARIAANGALATGVALWFLSLGARAQANKQAAAQGATVVTAGVPSAHDAVSGVAPRPSMMGPPRRPAAPAGQAPAAHSPLSEAELISIAARY